MTFAKKEEDILRITKRYKNPGNFFEMTRFDFILDSDLNAYLMEANMSPNLSSDHFPPNRLLYENVLYGLFSLVGLGKRTNFLMPRWATKMKHDSRWAEEEKSEGVGGVGTWKRMGGRREGEIILKRESNDFQERRRRSNGITWKEFNGFWRRVRRSKMRQLRRPPLRFVSPLFNGAQFKNFKTGLPGTHE